MEAYCVRVDLQMPVNAHDSNMFNRKYLQFDGSFVSIWWHCCFIQSLTLSLLYRDNLCWIGTFIQ
jgi:hypothetical protein